MEIVALGDSALIVRVVKDYARDPEAALNAVLAALAALEDANIPGVIELAPAYSTIGVFYDLATIVPAAGTDNPFVWLTSEIEKALKGKSVRSKKTRRSRMIKIPVCYDDEFALDIDDVARVTNLSGAEVVRRHSRATYRVSCIGFIAGFPFLSGLPPELATPRRATPRKDVPAGSVGIGGAQTGIYLRASPGGWNIIGRTPLRLFDVKRDPPTVLQTGDRLRFQPISRAEFDGFTR